MNNRGLIFSVKKRKINNDQNKIFYRIYKFDIYRNYYIIFNLINPIDNLKIVIKRRLSDYLFFFSKSDNFLTNDNRELGKKIQIDTLAL